jgi:hypothetical protein
MIYAQFYQKSAISDETIEACGDRSVIIIDGRLSKFNQMAIATGECSKRGYIAWRLFSGDFLNGTPKTPMFTVFNSEK